MKKNIIGLIALISLGVFVVFGVLTAFLATNVFRNGDDNSNNFTWRWNDNVASGETTNYDYSDNIEIDGIDEIKIEVVSTDVTIYNSTRTVDIDFQSTGYNTENKIKLNTAKTGRTLRIYVVYPRFTVFGFVDSSLSLGIPSDFSGDISINGVSNDTNMDNLNNELGKLSIDTTSGDVDAYLTSVDALDLDTTSGNFNIDTKILEEVYFNSVSGDLALVSVGDKASQVKCDTTSGKVDIVFAVPCETKIDTVSGDIIIDYINSGKINLDFDSVSGDVRGDYNKSSDGVNVNIDSVSGDLTIK